MFCYPIHQGRNTQYTIHVIAQVKLLGLTSFQLFPVPRHDIVWANYNDLSRGHLKFALNGGLVTEYPQNLLIQVKDLS